CQAGTYIRKLVHDWGLHLKVGAHMIQLVRTKVGPFNDSSLVSLHDLKDAYEVWKSDGDEKPLRNVILPLEYAVSHLPKVWVYDTTVDSLCHGASLSIPGISKVHSGIEKGDLVAVFSLKDELVCLGRSLMSSKDMMDNEYGLAVKTSKVFMDPNVYPKYVKKE
ncbi:MAG: PUA domain-containing protein, partial [Candidatus Nanoarchaeia archaeon]